MSALLWPMLYCFMQYRKKNTLSTMLTPTLSMLMAAYFHGRPCCRNRAMGMVVMASMPMIITSSSTALA